MKIEEQVLSREQMAHLVELGVDTSDASMMWVCCKDAQKERWYLQINNELSRGVANVMNRAADFFVPTYTIGDLIEKLPKDIEGSCLDINYIYSEIVYKDILHYDFEGVGLLNTLFAVLYWVAENHKELIK